MLEKADFLTSYNYSFDPELNKIKGAKFSQAGVTGLLAKYGEQARPLASLGYKQALQFLRGEADREAALAAAQQAHRNYAKRQSTWFRREPNVQWLAGFGDDPAIQAAGMAIVEPEI